MKKILSIFMIALIGIAVVSCVKDDPFPAPPLMSNFTLTPLIPEEGDPVTVRADVADISGVKSVKLFYKINDGQYVEVGMTQVGSSRTYAGTIPGQSLGTTVYYYVEAENVIDKKSFLPVTAPAEPASYKIGGEALIHYWHFNDMPGGAVTEVPSNFSFVGNGLITFPYVGSGAPDAGYMDERTYRAADPVSNLNLRMGQPADAGAVLRVRNPSAERELRITAPSTGFENLVVKFAISRSSDSAPAQEFYYSANGGTTWVKVGDAFSAQDIPTWELITIDLSSVSEVNNNPNLQFKFVYIGSEAANTSGNNRYDNLTVDGTLL